MLSKTQAQGRIKRQMKEQAEAIPLWDNIIVDRDFRDKQHNVNKFMENIQNRLAERMISEKMLDINPIVRVKEYGDKIRIDPIHPNQVYIGKSPKPVKLQDPWITEEKEELILTLTDGVFE